VNQEVGVEVGVHGRLIVQGGRARLCGSFGESDPPACFGVRFAVGNWQKAEAVLTAESGEVRWTSEPVLLVGRLYQRTFILS